MRRITLSHYRKNGVRPIGIYAEYYLTPFKAAAASFGVEAIAAPVHNKSELESVVAAQAHTPNTGLILMPDAFTIDHSEEITLLAARYRLPAIYPFRFITELGGLLSYGNNRLDNFRSVATYADRILKGAKPSELPVQMQKSPGIPGLSPLEAGIALLKQLRCSV